MLLFILTFLVFRTNFFTGGLGKNSNLSRYVMNRQPSNHHAINLLLIYFFCRNKVFGTTELPEKPIMLPPFVDRTHCLPYHLTTKGKAVADRVVSVLGFACPDITYSPSLYPITAILLHYMSGESIS